MVAQVTFTLDEIHCITPRSAVDDSDIIMMSVAVGPNVFHAGPRRLEMTSDNTWPVGLTLGPVDAPTGVPVAFAIHVANIDKNVQGDLKSALETVGTKLLNGAIPTSDKMVSTATGEAIRAVLTTVLNWAIKPCDGTVVAYTVDQQIGHLRMWMVLEGTGAFSDQPTFDGYDSPALCGKNSKYRVRFSAR